jgi:hypothetical protein
LIRRIEVTIKEGEEKIIEILITLIFNGLFLW